MILCNPTPFNRGACFYKQPVNISECQKWTVEFDYRIFEGTGADGIAFCFLNNPPNAFTVGGNIGIPARPQGLMVILDTYMNCTQLPEERVPKLEIRYADGRVTYGDNTENVLECPTPQQPTYFNLSILRQPNYNHMKITYDQGDVRVYINDVFYLKGHYAINFPGYFGFTASTGGSNDRHSIRNVSLYTFKPIVSPPNAGPDKTICSGEEIQLGVPPLPNDPYTYAWYPTTGLDNPTVSNPKVRLVNDSVEDVTYTYFVTKDSLVNDTLCAFSDDVHITVVGKIAQAGPDLTLCAGQAVFIDAMERDGYRYAWSPRTGLSNPDTARTYIRLENHTNAPVVYQYVLAVTPLASKTGCTVYDTLQVTVQPNGVEAAPDVTLCSGDTVRLGSTPSPGFNYIWSPVTGLDDATSANPLLRLTNTNATPQVLPYVVHAWNAGYVCDLRDTVRVTVLAKPVIAGPRSVCPNVSDVVYRLANALPSVHYQWSVQGGVLKEGQGTSRITVDWELTNANASVAVIPSNAPDCPARIPVVVNKVLKPDVPYSQSGSDTLCLAQAGSVQYATTNTSGSVYTWGVSGNAVIVNGQGTPTVTVDWQGTGAGNVWVSERSETRTDVCEGTSDTLRIWIEPAPAPDDAVIKSVSTQLDQEKNILLRFRVKPASHLSDTLTIERRRCCPLRVIGRRSPPFPKQIHSIRILPWLRMSKRTNTGWRAVTIATPRFRWCPIIRFCSVARAMTRPKRCN